MIIIAHTVRGKQVAEVKSDDSVIRNAEDGLDLLGELYYKEFEAIILYAVNISSEFFDLKTGIAGEILQKFSNYRMKLAIVGDFNSLTGTSIRSFISESNITGNILFVPTLSDALERL